MRSVLFALVVAGLCGILYGLAPSGGAISVALPYLKATTALTSAQLSLLVGACMVGAVPGGFLAGLLADRFGRRQALLFAAAVFAAGVPVVGFSGADHTLMMAGFVAEGFGAGVAGVVMPLYLAEVVPADIRGKCTALFQLSMIVGILLSGLIGVALALGIGAADSESVSSAAKTRCWKWVFLLEGLPALGVLALGFRLAESPVWLKKKGMGDEERGTRDDGRETMQTLFQRRYVIPFVLAVVILICTQTTGINVILGYSVTIFQAAGLSGAVANGADAFFKFAMLAMTAVACVLVDRRGRRFLLELGTLGIIGSLLTAGVVMFGLRGGWIAAGPVSGWLVAGAFSVFISAFAVGPGVCVWLALTELMPDRIRAVGMSVALFLNQGVSTALQSTLLPLTDRIGYGWLFVGFSAFTVVYWATVHFFLPETKGRTLEEIESFFTDKNGNTNTKGS